MPARATSSTYTQTLLNLISSTSYPPLPDLAELEALRTALQSTSSVVDNDIEKRNRKEKKRKEREEGEQAALEANERTGAKLEALERARLENQKAKKGSPGVKVKKERNSLSPAPSNASSASFRPTPGHSQPITYGSALNKKKKKQNRVTDSDDERTLQRDRSTTLASPPAHTSGLKLKLSNAKGRPGTQIPDFSPTPSNSTAAASAAIGSHIDFSLPPQAGRPLIPPRPGIQKPPKPGPKRQSEVDEDYSNVKAPNQVNFTTFWSGVEPYLKDIKEDDLAMLNFKADAPESYEIPPRGRHYTEIWDEEDGIPVGSTPRYPVPNMRELLSNGNGTNGTLPSYVPAADMRDESLVDENRGLGSFTERLVAAVFGDSYTSKAVKEAVNGRAAHHEDADPIRVDVAELEDRLKRELRSVMLLADNEEYDSNNRDDDEITSALRQCQRLLYQQTSVNDARKARLAEIARQRLAYGDYLSALEGIEKSIEASWAKRQKRINSVPKKHGTTPRPPVAENLKRLVAVRKEWVETIGRIMKERPLGEVSGLPTESIYGGIGEDNEEKDEEYVDDAMDVETMTVDE